VSIGQEASNLSCRAASEFAAADLDSGSVSFGAHVGAISIASASGTGRAPSGPKPEARDKDKARSSD
jgi:hypothetical protein